MAYGIKCSQGTRPYMQDRHFAGLLCDETHFFAVYDGHGRNGEEVAQHCADKLYENVQKLIEEGLDIGTALRRAFFTTDETAPGAAEAGSTAAVVILQNDMYWIAHCGDSRVIVGDDQGCSNSTEDHLPTRSDERDRIDAADGCVIYLDGTCRVMGVLAVSRSLGDHSLRQYGVTAEPDIRIVTRRPEDEFILIASDGLFSVMSNEEAWGLARRSLQRATERGVDKRMSAKIAANVLVKVSESRGLRDNLTVIVVNLARE